MYCQRRGECRRKKQREERERVFEHTGKQLVGTRENQEGGEGDPVEGAGYRNEAKEEGGKVGSGRRCGNALEENQ